jgi:hypothetical protein
MKNISLLFAFLTFLSGRVWAQDERTAHQERIRAARIAKDSAFKKEGSPLLPEKMADFKGLPYFPIDYTYYVKAIFKKIKKGKWFKMPTTTDRIAWYRRFAVLEFELEGKKYTLTAYQNQDLIRRPEYKDYLFIPFRDLTSNKETYGGGRYIDLRMPDGDTIILDFNLAYNPYCAYNYKYSCPIPPKENTLDMEIRAGEQIFE